MSELQDNFFEEFEILYPVNNNEESKNEYEENKYEKSVFINMTSSLKEILTLTEIKKDNDIDFVRMNSLYGNDNNQYNEWNISYDIKNDRIIINNIPTEDSGSNLIKEMRFIYSNKFKDGFRPAGKCPDQGIKSMLPEKYNDKTKLTFPVCIQPKYNGIKIMISPNSLLFNSITSIEHKTELLNFMAYIPHNCMLDLIIYSNNQHSSEVSKLISNNKYNTITYIICDFFCFDLKDCKERLDILNNAYDNYLIDYNLQNPNKPASRINIIKKSLIRVPICYSAENTEEVEEYKEQFIKNGYSGIIIKKTLYQGKKLEYKPGKSTRILSYK